MSKIVDETVQKRLDDENQINRLKLLIEIQKEDQERKREQSEATEAYLQSEISKYISALQESENELAEARELNMIIQIAMKSILEELNKTLEDSDKFRKIHCSAVDGLVKECQNSARECAQLRQANATLLAQVQNLPIALKRQYEAGYADGFSKGHRNSQPDSSGME